MSDDAVSAALWKQYRRVQCKMVAYAERNPHVLDDGEKPVDYANRQINALTNVQLIDMLTGG